MQDQQQEQDQQQQDWHTILPTEERLLLIKRLSESLNALSPTIAIPKILELAKTFENVIYMRSSNKEEYITAYRRKLQQILIRISEQEQRQEQQEQQQQDWRASLSTEERILLITRMCEELRALSPTIIETKIQDLSKTFESVVYARSLNKEAYVNAFTRKFQQIQTYVLNQQEPTTSTLPH